MLNSIYNSFLDETQKTQKRFENILSIKAKKLILRGGVTPFEVIGKFGRCRLLYYSPKVQCGYPPIFITPSIINKYYILDLMDGLSFIEHLKNANIPVYLIDWGEPRTQDRLATLEDHILHWLDWAMIESCRHAKIESIDILGQCIGGTFAAIYAALRPQRVKSVIALTTPISFHDSGLLSAWSNNTSVNLGSISDQWGNVYREFLKESFYMLKPLDRLRKYNNFFKYSWDDKFLDRYLALNHWVDDCIAFPGKTYVRYIQDFYQKNLLLKGNLKVGEELVELKAIHCPVLVICSKDDNIVPFDSAAILLDLISSTKKEIKVITGGHIGIVISSKVQERLWEPVENWIKDKGGIANESR